MKLQVSLLLLIILLGYVNRTIVKWYGYSSEYQKTEITGTGCTNVSSFKKTNLYGV